MPKKIPTGRAATADRIAALVRIYKSAVSSGDDALRDAASAELKSKYGIGAADLMAAPESKGGAQ
jgi:hypothetical protein